MGGARAILAASLIVATAGTARAAGDEPIGPHGRFGDIVVPSPCPGPRCRPPAGELEPTALGPRRVFVNFDSVTITRDDGWEDSRTNTSAILVVASKTLPGLRTSDVSDGAGLTMTQIEDEIIERMYSLYVPYEVEIVKTRPSSGNYHMVVFGSTCQQVADSDCVGISLRDCGDVMPNNVSFVFPTGFDMVDIGTTAAHEVGHALGLAHTNDLDDVMYPSIQWDPPPHFGAGNIPDGSGCDGATYQNSHTTLMETIGERGADYVDPSVTITSPANGATVIPGDSIRVTASDNIAVDYVEMFLAGDSWVTRDQTNFELFLPGWVSDGSLVILAKAYDHAGNTSSSRVVVTVDRSEPECTGNGDCPDGEHCDNEFCVPDEATPGTGALGDECTSNDECESGMCGQSSGGEQRCSQLCEDDTGCPDGFECLGDTACWPADPEEEEEPAKSIFNCSTTGTGGTPSLLLLLAAVLLTLHRRRRRRS